MMFSLDSSNELTGGLATKQAIYRLYKDVFDFLTDIEVLQSRGDTVTRSLLMRLFSLFLARIARYAVMAHRSSAGFLYR